MYGTTSDCTVFLSSIGLATAWSALTADAKTQTLANASLFLDVNFTYLDSKTDPNQEHEFPRGTDTAVPGNVLKAVYLIASDVASGRTAEKILDELVVTRRRIDVVETEYDRKITIGDRQFGVWNPMIMKLLSPYMANPNSIKVIRTS